MLYLTYLFKSLYYCNICYVYLDIKGLYVIIINYYYNLVMISCVYDNYGYFSILVLTDQKLTLTYAYTQATIFKF